MKSPFGIVVGKNDLALEFFAVYVVELALKLSPLPLSVQRKTFSDAESLYRKVTQCMEKGQPRLLELKCEQLEDKKVAVLVENLLAVQIYEKTASSGGSKRPGFSFDD